MEYKIGKKAKKRIEDAHALVKPASHLALEVLELLTSLYFLRQPLQESGDLIENLRSVHLGRLLQDDVVLRLCKFAHDDTRSWSFDQAHKRIRKHHGTEATTTRFLALQERYREMLRPVEAHRNAYVAHRAKRDRLHLKPIDFLDATRLAVEIVDVLAGEQCSYMLGNIDLRHELLGDTSTASA